jgi:hypothetical protein
MSTRPSPPAGESRGSTLVYQLPDEFFALEFGDYEAAAILTALTRQDSDPVVKVVLDALALTIRHIDALTARIDALPEDGCPSCGATRCCCAYDHPDDVCMTHAPTKTEEGS